MGDAGDFTGRLIDGERIVWTGRPRGGLVFVAQDIYLIPFSLVWVGFMFFWEAKALESNAGVFFALWGGMFVLFGLFMLVGRFAIDAWARSTTRYALTNRRILILRCPPFSKFTSLSLDRVADAQLTEHAGGRGTIRFGQESDWGRGSMAAWIPSLSATPKLIAIEDARDVFDRIQRGIARVA
jgi:hypothetical protein